MHEESKAEKQGSLIIRPSTGLVSLPDSGSSALSEIIDRSLAYMQTGGALAAPVRRAGEEQEFEIAPGVKIVMCWIPPGEFLMGSPEDEDGRQDDEFQHSVTLTQGFWLGKYQVTQAQWEAVMGSNPSRDRGSQLPVENVSWGDISGSKGFLETANSFAEDGGFFRLPTEAQWEYACRAGTVTALNNAKNLTNPKGNCPSLDEVAWYGENSGNMMHPVGQKKANAWGLHDMHGNVWEFCADWWADWIETVGPLVDPLGSDSGAYRVVRGGGWKAFACTCRSAFRIYFFPPDVYSSYGLRIARSSFPDGHNAVAQSK